MFLLFYSLKRNSPKKLNKMIFSDLFVQNKLELWSCEKPDCIRKINKLMYIFKPRWRAFVSLRWTCKWVKCFSQFNDFPFSKIFTRTLLIFFFFFKQHFSNLPCAQTIGRQTTYSTSLRWFNDNIKMLEYTSGDRKHLHARFAVITPCDMTVGGPKQIKIK